jgi:hypothetical protein
MRETLLIRSGTSLILRYHIFTIAGMNKQRVSDNHEISGISTKYIDRLPQISSRNQLTNTQLQHRSLDILAKARLALKVMAGLQLGIFLVIQLVHLVTIFP